MSSAPAVRRPAAGRPVVRLIDADESSRAAARHAPRLLGPEEWTRAVALRRGPDREVYVTAHVALRILLGPLLKRHPGDLPMGREACHGCGAPHGRPVVRGSRLHFSLSHSGRLILVAFAAEPVGVDIEQIASSQAVEQARDALHPAERQELDTLPEARRPRVFTDIWTRKEAYLKMLGSGLLRDTRLDRVGTGRPGSTGVTGAELTSVPVPSGYAAALCVAVPV
ncbi:MULTISPECIES: 4'-phosphopantetheinyl transferase family protein [Streptomyces]|uniref:Phosphopantetheinyl transferase n=1 Tax=Streptomyces avermitilis (strain ATCC 31267 / DSM 46492 / JCM 5070 / NBRC 14893 / NCIMB 12804 / NRRL 8165 / MA-4680) TaxID=227882 RepID=Q82IF5_STRAW|nr:MULTISPECIES: 4'-phosphopantetheinyl transferase superfamily protein [Streptomyces]MYS98789.1 4'-phosphopantetheinyl transferase superfamily protein [Streptomyces sp. SID5469]BAC70904.1 putative phosphopantetheinyl transferase [Streptomyces avermitilis MA-4680 = NBRC 14893]